MKAKPDRQLNLPNSITIARVLAIPLFLYLSYDAYGNDMSERVLTSQTVMAMVTYAAASFSDFIDGHIARKRQQITRLGQFLDPLADKLLLVSGLAILFAYRRFPWWAAAVIVAREIVVSVLRSMALRKGRSLPASRSGKIKTALQTPMVLIWMLPRQGAADVAQDVALYAAVAITLLSGARFYLRYSRAADSAAAR